MKTVSRNNPLGRPPVIQPKEEASLLQEDGISAKYVASCDLPMLINVHGRDKGSFLTHLHLSSPDYLGQFVTKFEISRKNGSSGVSFRVLEVKSGKLRPMTRDEVIRLQTHLAKTTRPIVQGFSCGHENGVMAFNSITSSLLDEFLNQTRDQAENLARAESSTPKHPTTP